MSWSDRADEPLSDTHPEARPRPTAGLLTGRFWREAADRAVKSMVHAVLIYWGGGDVLNLWHVDWSATVGVAAGGATLSVLTSIVSAPFGERSSTCAIRLAPLADHTKRF